MGNGSKLPLKFESDDVALVRARVMTSVCNCGSDASTHPIFSTESSMGSLLKFKVSCCCYVFLYALIRFAGVHIATDGVQHIPSMAVRYNCTPVNPIRVYGNSD